MAKKQRPTPLRRLQRSILVKLTSAILSKGLGICVVAAFLGDCSGGTGQSPLLPSGQSPERTQSARERAESLTDGYVYVTNRTNGGSSELVVYPGGTQNPAPERTVTEGLVDAMGVATDPFGDVYVANGNGGNVLEFSPGGASLLRTYSQGLVHPAGVTIAGDTLYVSDQGDADNGYSQQVFEYMLGDGAPLIGIAGIGEPPQLNEGIAVGAIGEQGNFFVAASSLTAIPTGACSGNGTFILAQNVLPTLWEAIPMSHNQQVSGLAFTSGGNLYAADPCGNDIAIYNDVEYSWTYSGKVAGTFDDPLYLTINDQLLAVPSAGTPSGSGYATVVDLTGRTPTITISKGLTHPVGAAAFVNAS
jgi:hypothetical protein